MNTKSSFLRTFLLLSGFLLLISIGGQAQTQKTDVAADFPFMNPNLPLQVRVDDLVSRMTLEEKVGQMQYTAPAIPHLGIPEYNWWNECLHGVARNGVATVFPQAIGMAATWNTELIKQEADVIATEARAKYYEAVAAGQRGIYQGLTFWSPNINIFRDPRWGRGQETYGEDPFLTSQIGKAFVQGLQGNDPKYFKVISTAKHFAVHSGPESERHRFDAWPSLRDLYDTYLPAFEVLVKDAEVYSVMSCYNRVYGVPSSANSFLFEKILRNDWGFKGYVVSDCWAISDIYSFHNFVPTAEKASSLSVRAGVDLACGPEYGALVNAVKLGYLDEYHINTAVKRLMEARFRLGLFDPPSMVPYAAIAPSANNTPEHCQLARKLAEESIVLLKNENNLLPLSNRFKTIAVIGPYAEDTSVLLGNYNGTPSNPVTLLQGLKTEAGKGVKVIYAKGVDRPEILASRIGESGKIADDAISAGMEAEAMKIASKSDIIIFAGGISPNLEGEEMDVKVAGFKGGDRTSLDLPASQQALLEKLSGLGKPIVFVLTNGSAIGIKWASEHVPAIVESWYPGEEGGAAVADVIYGKYNPSGRLPVTFYNSVDDLPAFENYSMEGRTYRYFRKQALYPFGYGLSYSSFVYSDASLAKTIVSAKESLQVSVKVKNAGKLKGAEVTQVYVTQPAEIEGQPIKSLVGFSKNEILAGETATITLNIPVSRFRHYEPATGQYEIASGTYELQIGTSSADIRQKIAFTVK